MKSKKKRFKWANYQYPIVDDWMNQVEYLQPLIRAGWLRGLEVHGPN